MEGEGSSEFYPLQYKTLDGGLEMPGPVLAGVQERTGGELYS